MNLDELVEEATRICSIGYRLNDQGDRIPDWADPDWRDLPPERIQARNDAIAAWEAAHGHDVRLDCYAEYGCQLIEMPWAEAILAAFGELPRVAAGPDGIIRPTRAQLETQLAILTLRKQICDRIGDEWTLDRDIESVTWLLG